MNKRVLIITYYWPPSGGAGVQRWLKFAKYLRAYGWEPIIYTPENGEIPIVDDSLQKEIPKNLTVLKTKIWEPYSVYKRFVGQKSDEKINTGFLSESKKSKQLEKIAVWLRGNFFIPDARKFWVKPSVKFLTDYLQKNPVHAIISSGPPHSMHLIALELKRRLNVPWLADFRDPWTNIDYYADLMLTRLADSKHHKLEQEVLMNADKVVCVSENMTKEFIQSTKAKVLENKFITITNGFDEDDVYNGVVELDKKFSIAHIGTLVKSRNTEVLWKVLSELINEDNSFASHLELKLVGKVDITVLDSIEKYKLTSFVNKVNYLSHLEVVKVQQQSQLLLLLINNTKNANGILPGKFFEYLSAKRPILGIGPIDGDAAKILQHTNAGKMCGYADSEGLKKSIVDYFEHFKKGKLIVNSGQIDGFSRKSLTGKLVEVLNKLS